MHSWILDEETGRWLIVCSKVNKDFSPQRDPFKSLGMCPYCNEDAKKELDEKRKRKQEFKMKKEKEEQEKRMNTLSGYFELKRCSDGVL